MVQGVAATLPRMITNPIQGPRSTAEPRSAFPAIGELAFSVMAEDLRNLGGMVQLVVTATACWFPCWCWDVVCLFSPNSLHSLHSRQFHMLSRLRALIAYRSRDRPCSVRR